MTFYCFLVTTTDAVVAMAEKIAGTEDGFVKMMNDRAKELGLNDTSFKNPHGLDTANHYSSAYDMMLIAKELVKHDEVLKYTSIYEDYLRQNTDKQIWLVNTNKLVRFYDGVDGLKTGYTAGAGYCLTATAKRNGVRFIAVAMGEPDSKTRNAEISSMLDYAFAQYTVEKVLSTDSILGTKEVEKGKEKVATIVPMEDINILYKKIDNKKNITYNLKVNKLKAPLKYGDVVGTIELLEDEKVIKTINVTVKNDVAKANFFELYLRNLTDIISGN